MASTSLCVHSVTQCLKCIAVEWIIFATSREEMNVIIDTKCFTIVSQKYSLTCEATLAVLDTITTEHYI